MLLYINASHAKRSLKLTAENSVNNGVIGMNGDEKQRAESEKRGRKKHTLMQIPERFISSRFPKSAIWTGSMIIDI